MTEDQLAEARGLVSTQHGRARLLQHIPIHELAHFVGQLRHMPSHQEDAIRMCELVLTRHPEQEPFMNVQIASLVDLGQTRNASRVALRFVRQGRSPYFMRTLARLFSTSGLPGSAVHIFARSETGAPMTADEARLLAPTLQWIAEYRAEGRHHPANGAWYFENTIELEQDEPATAPEPLAVGATTHRLQPLVNHPLKCRSQQKVSIRAITSRQQIDRATNYLKNCLSQYWKKVKSGETWIYVVERDGKPFEAIEVHPTTRKVLQWKGVKNCAPDGKLKSALAKELVAAGVLTRDSLSR
jgi:hypothetical protein